MESVFEKDSIRSFQSPVRGEEIMKYLISVKGRELERLKRRIEEAILNGDIKNTHKEALVF